MKKKPSHSHSGRLSPGRNRICYLLLFLLLFVSAAKAQTKTPLPPRGEQTNRVGGTIQDASGNPLPGVSVTIKGTGMGTTTDSSGKFRITVPDPQSVLVFTLVSYEIKEEIAGRKQKMLITLRESGNSLNDVIVIGYGTAKKRDLAGSITSISSKQLEERHPASLGDALQGMAAGVLVTTSSVPGAQPNIRIRGYSTFSSAGNNPLYVIDGVLSDNMDWVNPNDVQSVEILKDAASAAIYGSRSANGVIIITTKRGAEGKPRINVQYLHTSGILAHKLPQANSMEVRLYRQEQQNSLTAGGSTDSLNPNFNADNDYQDVLTRVAQKNQVDFGVSGGAKNMNYFTSVRALEDQGLVVNSYAKSLLLRANIEFSPSSKFKYTSRFQFGYSTGNKIDEGNTIFQAFQRPANYALYFPDGTLTGYISGRRNPLSVALLQVNRFQNYQGTLFSQIEYQFIPSLKFTTNAVINYTEGRTQGFLPKLLSSASPTTNAGSEGFNRNVNWQYQAFFNYNKTFHKDHFITALAGFSAENTQYNNAALADVNYVSEDILTLNSGTLVPSGTTTGAYSNSLASLFGRASYSYKGKYIFNALVRRDGSSRFGANNRWGNFVSGALAWRFTDERFMSWSGGVLDDGKLRVSVGQTGNERIGNYDAQSKYDFGTFFYNQQSGVAPNTTIGNPNLKWESTLQSDVGVDLSFYKGRLLVVADYYVKTTSDLLYSRPLPRETGYNSVRVNVGTVQNKGFELTLTGKPLVKRNFDWLVTYNLTIERGVVKKLNGGQSFISGNSSDAGNAAWLVREGGALGDFYGWKQLGVYAYDQSNAYNDNWERLTPNFDKSGNFQGYTFKGQPYTGAVHSVYGRSTKLQGGDVEFANLNKDSVIDNSDRTVLGNAQPKFYFAVMNTLHYKQFTLSFTFNTQWGNKIYNNAARVLDDYGTSNIIPQPYVIYHMWRKQGDVTNVPVYRQSSVGNVRVSDRFLEDGSFIRLAYLQLNYTVPPVLSRKVGAQSINAYVYGSNLLTWTNYTWYDPEFTSSDPLQIGQDGGNYPRRREIGLGLNIYF